MKKLLVGIAVVGAVLSGCKENVTPPPPDDLGDVNAKDQLLPLAKGNWWRYSKSTSDAAPSLLSNFWGEDTIKVVYENVVSYDNSNTLLGNWKWYSYASRVWSPQPDGIYFSSGISSENTTTAQHRLPHYPVSGEEFTVGSTAYTVVDTNVVVTTFAGTFNCIEIVANSIPPSERLFFARNIGLVKSIQYDFTTSTPTDSLLLISYHVQ